MIGDEIDDLKRRAYAAEKKAEEQNMVSLLIVSIIMAVIVVTVANLSELWILPLWGVAYFALNSIKR